ncbi:MATH domain and coiled-coil domain-containing protein At2g05410 [Eutrema salsugineum]|uniref:MATH domain and coiled-coil domain-containing protein At2g05410 n=1 Tax=Eutrema salsugineum TaxID=72664 RepID=UPI000CED4BB5|nr:MATH domain and coiled-coil domain-containing protein At2g05410 [Eutrema salsugineum]
MGNQPDEKFTWVIKNFSSLQSKRIYSDIFVVGSCRWRLVAYPKGNDMANHISLFLAVSNSEILPVGWRIHAKYSFTIVNQLSDKLSRHEESQQKWYDQNALAWGYRNIITLTKLNDKEGFLVNGKLIVAVKVEVLEVVGKFEESSPVMETIDGFQVLPSQVRNKL